MSAKPSPLRTPPHDIQAEQAVLGAMMLGDGAADVGLELLTRNDFYRDVHAHIFDGMEALRVRSEPVDAVTLKDELHRTGILERIGGIAYLIQLGDAEFTTANLAHYARIVREKATLRRLIAVCGSLATLAYAEEETAALLERAEREMFALRPRDANPTRRPLQELLSAELSDIEARGKAQNGGITGLPTGFPCIDRKLSGLQRGDFLLLAARPSVGKSALASCIAANVTKGGGTTLFFSLEMSGPEITQRILTAESRVDSHAVRTGQLDERGWEWLLSGVQRLWDGHCFIDDNTQITPGYLRSECRRVRAEHGLDLVVIDYLQLMNGGGDGRAGENRNAELSQISRSLKLLAKEFDVPVLALSQLSRAVEKRENKRPLLSDLRDSGSLEQDADVVMFLHREGYAGDKPDESGSSNPARPDPTELIIRKHRKGPTGTVNLLFLPQFARFENAAIVAEVF